LGWGRDVRGPRSNAGGGALLLTASLTLAIPLSINFASSLNLDPAPLKTTSLMIGSTHEFSLTPEPDDGPVTVTRATKIRLWVTTFRPTGYRLHLASVGSKKQPDPSLSATASIRRLMSLELSLRRELLRRRSCWHSIDNRPTTSGLDHINENGYHGARNGRCLK